MLSLNLMVDACCRKLLAACMYDVNSWLFSSEHAPVALEVCTTALVTRDAGIRGRSLMHSCLVFAVLFERALLYVDCSYGENWPVFEEKRWMFSRADGRYC